MGLLEFLGKTAATPSPKLVKPKVLIGVAAFQGIVPEAQENFFRFAYRCGRDYPDYDFFVKFLIKREQFRARNNVVDMAIVNDCEYLLMLDDDMIVPPDLFGRLVAHGKDVVGCLYYQRGGAYHPVIMKQTSKKDGLKGIQFIQHFDRMITSPGLYKLDGVIGGGCMLFKTDVFRKIPQPYFWIDGIVGTDVHVCNQLRGAGIDIWVDTSIELGHVGEPQVVTSRTIPKYSRTVGEINEQLWGDLREYFCLTDDQLESEIVRASNGDARLKMWQQSPRETWEQVRAFYQEGGDWHVKGLAAFNLEYDQARDWAINDLSRLVKPDSRIIDYGAGIGYCTIPLAQRSNMRVVAVDLAGSPTMDFLKWRIKKHGLDHLVETQEFGQLTPQDLREPADGILLISVLDHLWAPYETLEWVNRNVRTGGFILCDTWRNMKDDNEPQHLIRYDPHRILHDFRRMGWRDVPENPFLFLKEK